jgi:hypothetical protein
MCGPREVAHDETKGTDFVEQWQRLLLCHAARIGQLRHCNDGHECLMKTARGPQWSRHRRLGSTEGVLRPVQLGDLQRRTHRDAGAFAECGITHVVFGDIVGDGNGKERARVWAHRFTAIMPLGRNPRLNLSASSSPSGESPAHNVRAPPLDRSWLGLTLTGRDRPSHGNPSAWIPVANSASTTRA